MSELSNRYQEVLHRVAAAAVRSGRAPEAISLIAVSKGRSVREIEALHRLGHRDFGENRAQELREKVPALPDDVRWHFVGPLQSNKVRTVRPAVTLLHSLDRMSLAKAWMKGAGPAPDAMLQINIGEEEQKSGVMPEDAMSVMAALVRLSLPIIGIMAIPPNTVDPEESRPYFEAMRSLRDWIAVDHPRASGLSMGMSNDFEIAIEAGATAVRIGRAIFQD